jgi:hypothetical protein
MRLARDTVRDMIEKDHAFPGAIRYTETVGWRVPRSGLVEYYAKELHWDARHQAG